MERLIGAFALDPQRRRCVARGIDTQYDDRILWRLEREPAFRVRLHVPESLPLRRGADESRTLSVQGLDCE